MFVEPVSPPPLTNLKVVAKISSLGLTVEKRNVKDPWVFEHIVSLLISFPLLFGELGAEPRSSCSGQTLPATLTAQDAL